MSNTKQCDVAVVGLGVMGANLARNFARHGKRVLGFARHIEDAEELVARYPEFRGPGAELTPASTWTELVAQVARPRRILLLVPAGEPVDQVLDALGPLLEEDDVVVDCGNSHYLDTDRRIASAAGKPWRFVGMGVSGGAEGALNGPSMMPGGDRDAWTLLRPLLEEVAATSAHGPCVTYCGRGSAGHFVKMVHNGIEYGDMQLIAETAVLLRQGLGLRGDDVAEVFAEWDRGELDSFLVSITVDIFRTADPEQPGALLLDAIQDRAGQKGTGAWTVQAALELGVAIPTIGAAVDARVLSSGKELRDEAQRRFGIERRALDGIVAADLEQALFAAKLASYTQGFALLAAANEAYDYGVEPVEIARIWTGGCIIRARLLERVMEAFREVPPPELLAFAFAPELTARLPAWRRVVAAATTAGLPVPGLSASLAWFDTLTTARGSANLIQAQRDHFGSHTYERVERPGEKVHTEWS